MQAAFYKTSNTSVGLERAEAGTVLGASEAESGGEGQALHLGGGKSGFTATRHQREGKPGLERPPPQLALFSCPARMCVRVTACLEKDHFHTQKVTRRKTLWAVRSVHWSKVRRGEHNQLQKVASRPNCQHPPCWTHLPTSFTAQRTCWEDVLQTRSKRKPANIS